MGLTALPGCSGGGGDDGVVVPDVAGLHPDAAAERICAAGLAPGGVDASATLPEARSSEDALARLVVRASDPRAGSRVARGTPVTLRTAVPEGAGTVFQSGRC